MNNRFNVLAIFCLLSFQVFAQAEKTYAEKLGFPKGKKVLIFHVYDCGMSYSSNQGAYKSMEQGVATSCSIMMPCPWAASFIHYLQKNNPKADAGLHLTLTSEWKDYRWPALAGFQQVPGLSDGDGCLYHSVEQVIKNASPDEVEREIRAQVERAKRLGWAPSHLDSHMGTLFAYPPFLERYVKVGIELGIPVMFPGGNNKMMIESMNLPLIKKMKAEGHALCVPKLDAEEAWVAETADIHRQTLMAQGGKVHSWMMGANLANRSPRVLIYFGGANVYYDKLRQSAAAGFPEVDFEAVAG